MSMTKKDIRRGDFTLDDVAYFRSKVKDGKWVGPVMGTGYGAIWYGGALGPSGGNCRKTARCITAHAFAYAKHYGKVPKGTVVRHKCDASHTKETGNKLVYKLCVDWRHLELGTEKDNNRDCRERKRADKALGEECGAAKLTWGKVQKMRVLYENGWSSDKLGSKFGVSPVTAWSAATGRTWSGKQKWERVDHSTRKDRTRYASGEDAGPTKLTWEKVEYIRSHYVKGKPGVFNPNGTRSLAKKFGVTAGAISLIVTGRTWVSKLTLD